MVSGRFAAFRRSPSAQGFLFVAAIAFIQFFLAGRIVASQHDAAHVINISGAQRMRSQRIAYLALAARTGHAARGWRSELEETIDDMLAVRRELLQRRDLLPPLVDAAGETAASRAIASYTRAALVIERRPQDATAFAYIDAHRAPLLGLINDTVTARTEIVERHNAQLLTGLIAGLTVMLASMALIWLRFVAPSERRTAQLIARLDNSEAQLRSLYRENPDSIAMYDRAGTVLRSNRASRVLLGIGSTPVAGGHFLDHVDASQSTAAAAAFATALGGERTVLDTLLVDSQGRTIDVKASLFPNVVDGAIVGVIGVAKDTRELRLAEAAYRAQTERITELYRVCAYQDRPARVQVAEMLAVAVQRLGYAWGAAIEMRDGPPRAAFVLGDAGLEVGEVLPFPPRLAARAARVGDLWSIDDVSGSGLRSEESFRALHWAALTGIPILAGSQGYGLLVLGAARAREHPLEAADRDFLRLVATLVAASIQRGRHEQRLDALAFFDDLTGLANRVLLADRMKQLLAAATRRKEPFAVHCLDLDHFKAINDTFGHAAGDEVLRIVAARMIECVRQSDTVARVGGDEFVILQALDPSGRGSEELAQRLLLALSKPFEVGGRQHHIGVSIGISFFPVNGRDGTTLLHVADEALLRAKAAGRNRSTVAVA